MFTLALDLKPLTKVISLYNKLNHETDTFVVAIRLKFGLDGLEIAWDALDEAYCRAKSASRAAHLKKVREDNQRAGEAGPSTSSNITSLKEAGPSTSSNNKTSHVLKEEGDNHESEDNLEKKDKTDPESESENESDSKSKIGYFLENVYLSNFFIFKCAYIHLKQTSSVSTMRLTPLGFAFFFTLAWPA